MAVVVLAAACARPVVGGIAERAGRPGIVVWALDHGYHTALVFRRADVDRALWPAADDVSDGAFLEVAWGDRDFYMAPRGTLRLALMAAFRTRGSVLHVVGFAPPVAAAFPRSERVELRLDGPGFAALTRFVADTYRRDADGRVVRIGPSLYGAGAFYAAHGRYSLSNTCNTWVARALLAAGIPVRPAAVVTAGDLMWQLASIGAAR